MRARQQATVADLGLQALSGADLQLLMDRTVGLVARTLGVEFCEILDFVPEDDKLLLRAGVGRMEELVGWATEQTGRGSQAGFTLASGEPVILEDLREETRFDRSPLLEEHGVVSGVTVVISDGRRRFGVLGAHTTRHRTFTEDDVDFLGAVANLLATAIEHRRAEEQVRFQSRLLQQVPATVIATDLRGTVTYWNDHAESMHGYSREEALGRDITELTISPTEDRTAEEILKRAAPGEPWEGELVARRRDGSTFPAHVVDSPVRDAGGRAVGAVHVYTDITDHKLAEEALLEIRETERRRIARDLHDVVLQDLASVVQSLQAASMRSASVGSDESLQRVIGRLRDASRNLRTTVLNLRLQNGQGLVQGVESLVHFARRLEPKREVKLDIQPGFPEESSGRAYPELLRVVQEALVNVQRHSGASHVAVRLWVEGDEVCAEVADDGRGFEPGRVLDGVGLSVMKERMVSLRGRLEVRSHPGRGTTVTATVPFF